MGKQTNHHFIPACYLKGFTNGGERDSRFWAFPKDGVKKTYGTNPNDTCSKNNYYKLENNTNSLLIEKWYGDVVEPKIGKFLDDLKLNMIFNKDNEGFIWLLSSLFLRTPLWRNSIESPLRRCKEIAISMKSDIDTVGGNLDISGADFIKDDIICIELEQIKTVANSLFYFNFKLCTTQDNINIITSDAPFILANPDRKIFGLLSTGTILLIPINKNMYIVGTKDIPLNGTYYASKYDVANINTIIWNASEERVFSNNERFIMLDNDDNTIFYP